MRQANKAVILARGLGTRMRRAEPGAQLESSQAIVADGGVKGMIPFGRPFLDYVLSGLAEVGFSDACLVIGPEHDSVREHYEGLNSQRIQIHFAVQKEARGTADAVLAAEEFASDDEFIVVNSDNYYPAEVLRTLREMGAPGAVMFVEEALIQNSNIPAERIRQFAYAKVNEEGLLIDLVEKPGEQDASGLRKKSLVSMNCWRFGPEIFTFCRSVPLSPRGEYELPVAVKLAIDSGMKLRIIASQSGVLDLSVRGDISAVASRLRDIKVSL